MIMIISPRRQSAELLFCQECINVIRREGRNIFVYSTQEVAYRITVSVDSTFFQVPLLSFITDLGKNIFVHKNLLESSVCRDNYPSGGALAS